MNKPILNMDADINKSGHHLPQLMALSVILALGVVLRLVFVTGMVYLDDFEYAQTAFNLTQSINSLSFVRDAIVIRPVVYMPVSIFYFLFGVNEITTLAYPFICSIFTIILVYLIGRILAGEGAGIIAALFWAVLPTSINMATALLPDGPLAMFATASVLCVILSEQMKGRLLFQFFLYFFSFIFLGLACLTKISAIITVLFIVVYILWARGLKKWLITGTIITACIIVLLGISYLGYQLVINHSFRFILESVVKFGETSTDLFSNLTTKSELFSISPLFIVAIVVSLAKKIKSAIAPIIWFCILFMFFEWGSTSLEGYSPMPTTWMTRQVLFILVPFVILLGIYLAQSLRVTDLRWATIGIALITGFIVIINRRDMVDLPYWITGLSPYDEPFTIISRLCTAIAIFGGIASPWYVVGQPSRIKTILTGVLLLCCGLSTLEPTYDVIREAKLPWKQNFNEVINYLESQPKYPIYVQNALTGLRLNYASGFRLGFDYYKANSNQPDSQIKIAKEDSQIDTAYILSDEYSLNDPTAVELFGAGPTYMKTPPDSWWKLVDTGNYDGYKTRLYWFTSSSIRQLPSVVQSAKNSPNQENLINLMKVATNARDFCTVISAWEQLQSVNIFALSGFDSGPALSGCYDQNPTIVGENLIINGDFKQGFTGWYHAWDWPAVVDVETDVIGSSDLLHVKYDGGDWKVVSQEHKLQPNTWYMYEMMVKSSAPVTVLYWETDKPNYFEKNVAYPQWTHIRYVFRTPGWDAVETTAYFYPILMNRPGEAWIKEVRLDRFNMRIP